MNFYEQIADNKRKTNVILACFVFLILFLGYVLGVYVGSPPMGLFVAFMFSLFYGIIIYFSGTQLVLTLSHAVPAKKEQYPHYVNTVEGLALAAGIPTPLMYVINDTAINAFATGLSPKRAAITVTTGALHRLHRTELEGVIGHEMSHIKNYDIRVMLIAAVFIGIIAMLSDVLLRTVIYGRSDRREKGSGAIVLILFGVLLAIFSPLIAELLRLTVSRKREFLADASGAQLTRHPSGLASALKKIRDDHEPLVEAANKATAHLYIENPLRTFGGKMNSLFSTHPDINERIKRLEGM
ncbi:M48 family metalloprotease [Candidatus Woesearchaeota archaeon]|nr:M48 family metalloprotease [Candidatus Woesearchaeota archaeon]